MESHSLENSILRIGWDLLKYFAHSFTFCPNKILHHKYMNVEYLRSQTVASRI